MGHVKTSIAAALSVAILSACTISDALSGNNDAAQGGQNMAITGAQDAAVQLPLDTGDFHTAPQDVHSVAAVDVATVTAMRLTEFVPLPYEIDATVRDGLPPTWVVEAHSVEPLLGRDSVPIVAHNQLVGGYINAARTSAQTVADPQFLVYQGVLRFADVDSARVAAQQLQDLDAGVGVGGMLADSVHGQVELRSTFVSYQDFVVCVWVVAPQGFEPWQAAYADAFVERQRSLLGQFSTMPATLGAESAEVRQHGLYRTGDETAARVFGPRGMAAMFRSSQAIRDALIEAGSEHNVQSESLVFRADNDYGARLIVGALVMDAIKHGGVDYAPEKHATTDSACFSQRLVEGTRFVCVVSRGRYVAQVDAGPAFSAADQRAAQVLLSQKLAAQHAVLSAENPD